jgi:SAM-dependent methyltransferase
MRTALHPGLALRRWSARSPSTRDWRLIAYLVRTRGVRGALFQRHLGDDFFEKHVAMQKGYSDLARILNTWANPTSVCDLGCGNAYILADFARRSIRVQGVDASDSVLRFADPLIRPHIVIRDLCQPQDLGRFDLVICTEVGEHVPKRSAHALVGNVARHAKKHVFFTAAQPGQWGVGHINCQPQDYWISLFAARGLVHDPDASGAVTREAMASPSVMESLPWLVPNIMMFTR